MAVPTFEAIGKVPAFDDIAAAPTDIATMPDDQFPEDVRDQADHIRNAYYYARNLGLDPNVAYDYEGEINELLYGPGTSSAAAWGKTRGKILGARRKGWAETVEDAAVNIYHQGQKFMAGMGRVIAETEARMPKPSWDKSGLGVADPAFRWLFGVPDNVDVAQFMADLSNAVSADIKQYQNEHPEMGLAIDPDAGWAETVWQMFSRPKNLLQGTLEAVPMILEGILGTMVAGPGGAIVAMALPRMGEIYQDARADGTEVFPAFTQALVTSGIEAAIEQWTLGKKIALGKNVRQILTGGPGRKILWEGTKAFFRGSAEEGSQQFNENLWRWVFTDRSQKWFEGVQQATAVGGPLEMAMSGGFAAAGRIGAPVEYREAQRRLSLLRKIVQGAPMSETERAEILAELDKVEGIIPDILLADGAMEVEGGEAAKTPTNVPEGGPGVVAEAAKAAAPLAAQAAPGEAVIDVSSTTAKPGTTEIGPTKEPGGQPAATTAGPAAPDEVETPEEAKAAEAQLKAEGREIVEPKLHIGNVTARMKEKMSEALTEATGKEVSPADIGPFKEGAWPTKRTSIKLTRGQAEQYLQWLESDLQRRLDENLINTYEDMAQANADWGDVVALRKVLGIDEQIDERVKAAKKERSTLRKQLAELQKKRPSESTAAKIADLEAGIAAQDEIISSGGRPWFIAYSQKRGEIVRDQGEVQAAQKELEQLRAEFDRAKTDMDAEEIMGQIEAKLLEIDRLQRAAGKAVKIIKDTQTSVMGAVQPSRLQESKMTVGQVLSAVLRRSARQAKMSYAQGRRELRADMRAKARARSRLKKALRQIKQKVPSSTDFFYREAIEALKSNFDLKHRSKRTLAQRKATKAFLDRATEEQKATIPAKVFDMVMKKPLNDMTIEEIENVAQEVVNLVQLGKLKRRLAVKPKLEQFKTDLSGMMDLMSKAAGVVKRGLIHVAATPGQKWLTAHEYYWRSLTPARQFDMLDGMKGTFSGLFHRVFYDDTKKETGGVIRTIHATKRALKNEMKRLDVTPWTLMARRTVLEGQPPLTSEEIIGIYMAAQNPLSRLHLVYGHEFTEGQIQQVIDAATPQEKELAEWLFGQYEQDYPRLRRSVIEQENRDMGQEERYSPIIPIDSTWKSLQQEVKEIVDQRLRLRAHNVAHGITLERKNVPEWMRGRIRLNAVSMFLDHKQKQERYIRLGPQVRRMRKLLRNTQLRKAIEDKFGTGMLKELDGYVGSVANPYAYRQFTKEEWVSAKLRQHTAIAYLAYNAATAGRQIFALMFYAPEAQGHLFASMADFVKDPIGLIQRVRSLDPEIADPAYERELEELKQGTNANLIMAKIGEAGLHGIFLIDQVARCIGWNAIYEKAISEGATSTEAARQARNTTLRTQNAASPEDIPSLYRSNEFLNWFTLFTNQTNKMWNMATYDYRVWTKEDQAKAMLGYIGLAINALAMWMITHRRAPEKPEDWLDVFSEQSLEMIPVVGKFILDVSEGYSTEVPLSAPLKPAGVALKVLRRGVGGEWEISNYEIKQLLEGAAIGLGVPYIAPKRAIEAAQEGSISPLFGKGDKKKKKQETKGIHF